MTDWKFNWEHPPLSDADWAREFAKYKNSPEYRKTNAGMTVDEYKFIYWMEYGHRMWGRGLGVYFALPLAYFVSRGYVTGRGGLATCICSRKVNRKRKKITTAWYSITL